MLIGIDAQLYEMLNLAISMLSFFAAFIVARYLVIEYRTREGTVWDFWFDARAWQHDAAIGMLLLTVGEGVIRGWTWYARIATRMRWDTDWMDDFPYAVIPVMGAIIQITGLLCITRIIAPSSAAYMWPAAVASVVVALAVSLSL